MICLKQEGHNMPNQACCGPPFNFIAQLTRCEQRGIFDFDFPAVIGVPLKTGILSLRQMHIVEILST